MERKSGILVLSDDQSKDVGRIFMRQGRVLSARIEGKAAPTNEECVYHMLRWSAGAFEFDATDVEMDDEIEATTMHLLMEGARRMDEDAR